MIRAFFFFCFLIFSYSSYASDIDNIKSRGSFNCGVIIESDNISNIGKASRRKGFFPDFCKAFSVMIFGEEDKVNYININYKNAYERLKNKDIDVLSAPIPYFYNHKDKDLFFSPPVFFDRILLASKNQANRLSDFKNATVCYGDNFLLKEDLIYYVKNINKNYKIEKNNNFDACDIIAIRQIYSENLNKDYYFLQDDISDFYYAFVTRAEDKDFSKMIFWTLFNMVKADTLNIKSLDVDEFLNYDDISVKELLNNKDISKLNLSNDCFYRVIKNIGSYSEVYKNNFENQNKYNKSWIDGGLILPPPLN